MSGWPRWRAQFIATAAVALVMLVAGLRRELGPWNWTGWSAVSLALGLALVFQWEFVTATSQSAWGFVGGAGGAALSVAAAALLGARAAGSPRMPAASLADLVRALRAPLDIVRAAPLRLAAFVALVTLPAAWIGLTLAFAPRYRDIPLAQFALPALAVAVRFGGIQRRAPGEHREEAVLAFVLLVSGVMQLEPANPESGAWLAICALLALPWLGALSGEFARVRRVLANPRQT